MRDSGENVRFEFFINGISPGIGGVERTGVLGLIFSWVRRAPDPLDEEHDDPEFDLTDGAYEDPEFDSPTELDKSVRVRLGGLDSVAKEHLERAVYSAQVGDEIMLRILPPGPVDERVERRPVNDGCNE
jgi:hypothetical protein